MPWFVVSAAVVIVAGIFVKRYFRGLRRKRLAAKPIPAAWEKILERNVSLYMRLPGFLKEELHGHIQILLAEKNFEGCGGLAMTDEIRVTIAAHAGMLLLNKRPTYYPRLHSILVYPNTFVSQDFRYLGNHAYLEGQSAHLGESWRRGALVLAWDSVKQEAMGLGIGQNVVLHEFAHQLDQEDGAADGAPVLGSRSAYATWAHTFSEEYEKLRMKVHKGLEDVMDEYGATDPAEFFAVATETFFEKPQAMKQRHAALYEVLKNYYKLDPAAWTGGGGREN
jgi:Mlc titration factor MtfA (ptsG expression regulator)